MAHAIYGAILACSLFVLPAQAQTSPVGPGASEPASDINRGKAEPEFPSQGLASRANEAAQHAALTQPPAVNLARNAHPVTVKGVAAPARQSASRRRARAKPRAATLVVTKAPGPYYVDFRARTAQTYGHAFVWFGKSSRREVDVAGLHPAGDGAFQYILGHVLPVPAETGASYGDLDEDYLTASYRVYLSEADAMRVFGYIQYLQANSPFWNATTYNCTAFIGRIASYMGLQTPFHLLVPEDYVNKLKDLNGSRSTVVLATARN